MARNLEFDPDEVLEKALNLFTIKGYHDLSTSDLVEGLKISRSSLYNYFGDKKGLFIKSLEKYHQNAQAQFSKLDTECQNSYETIKNLLYSIKNDCICDSKSKGCFILNASIELAPHDKKVREIVNQNRLIVTQYLKNILKKGQDKKQINLNHDLQSLADFFYSVLNSLKADSKSTKDESVYQNTIEIALSVIK